MADLTLLKNYEERLARLVALPSVSCPIKALDQSNRGVIDELAARFSEYGFTTKREPVASFYEEKAKENLIASMGKGHGGLVLSGHTDTVPYNAERWASDPFTLIRKNDRLYGLGATDMKGFFPVIMAALDRLSIKPADLKAPITILATADEESSMAGARALSRPDLNGGRFALIGEPTELKPIHMHKGIMMERITVEGQAGHSSNPALGNNAIDAMHRVLAELTRYRDELAERFTHPGFELAAPTLNFGCIHGGDSPNRICGRCELEHDVRMLPGMNSEDIRAEIKARLDSIAQETDARVTIAPLAQSVPAFEQSRESDWIQTVAEFTEQEPISVAFTTEAPFLQALGCNTVVLGPGSIDQAHQADEYIALSQIEPAVELLCQLISKCCLTEVM